MNFSCDKPLQNPTGSDLTKMSDAQFFTAMGMWLATPPIAPLPDADGGFMGDFEDAGGVIILTHGKMVCTYMPLPKPIWDIFKKIKKPGDNL